MRAAVRLTDAAPHAAVVAASDDVERRDAEQQGRCVDQRGARPVHRPPRREPGGNETVVTDEHNEPRRHHLGGREEREEEKTREGGRGARVGGEEASHERLVERRHGQHDAVGDGQRDQVDADGQRAELPRQHDAHRQCVTDQADGQHERRRHVGDVIVARGRRRGRPV